MKRFVKTGVQIALVIAVFAGGAALVMNRQNVLDWWSLQGYEPAKEVKQLADNTAMQGWGREMFYVSRPEVNDRGVFNQNCSDMGEKSVVLGCYRAQKIFLFNVTDPRLDGVKEVTAAHEMLHAAYERLSSDKKAEVNDLLHKQMATVNNQRLRDLIKLYNESEPGELLNEMHSIIGTEYRDLMPELETYYKTYFYNRSQVVGYAERYVAVFTASQKTIEAFEQEMAGIKIKIDANTADLEKRKASLDQESGRLDSLRQSDVHAYNLAVPGYNASVRAFNTLAVATRDLVNRYNELVVKRNNEAAAQSDLYNSLDSKYQPVTAN